MKDNIPFESVKPHLESLSGCGFYHVDSQKSKIYKFIHECYMRFILACITLYTVQQIVKIYQVRDDVNKVIDTMFLMLTNSDALYKQVLFWKRQQQIEEVLELLKSPLFDRDEPKHRALLISTSRQAKVLLRGFNIAALATCLLWVLHPLILHLQGKPVEFAVWMPFDYNRNPQFYYAIVYQWVQTSWLAFGNTSMDTFITYLYAQCKTQIAILRLELENIVDKCTIETKTSTETFATIYQRNFKTILLHYNDIVTLAIKTEKIFGNAILYFFMVSGWIMCTSAYRMIHIDNTSVAYLSMIFYIICILIEIYLYCYFGNEVAHEYPYPDFDYINFSFRKLNDAPTLSSESMGKRWLAVTRFHVVLYSTTSCLTYTQSGKLMESAFGMDWHRLPVECRYSLILFMERIKRSIVPTAGSLVPLSNNTFVSILRSSYTFYTFLKNTD